MTATFDGSSGPAVAEPFSPTREPVQPYPAATPTAEPYTPDSLLDQLAAEIQERDAEEIPPWVYRVKGVGIRFVCDPDVDYEVFQRWMKLATRGPGGGRRRRAMAQASDLDQMAISARAMVETNTAVEVLRRGTDDDWSAIPGLDGSPLTLASEELLRKFNSVDPIACLRKIFGKDAALIDAGQSLLDATGYMGEDDEDDESGPTRPPGYVKTRKKR